MNFKSIINVLSIIGIICGAVFFSAAAVAYFMGDAAEAQFFFSIYGAAVFVFSAIFFYLSRAKKELGTREGFLIVVFGWLEIVLLGSVPFYWFGLNFTDALFETASGFTTTGASVLDSRLVLRDDSTLGSFSSLPNSLLYWRAMTQWLGGMGIIVLYLAIMPYLGISGKKLYNAEASSSDSSKLMSRISDTAKMFWIFYLAFSICQTLLLWIGGMSVFEAWCHTCATLATGGFSTRSESISAFDNLFIEIVIIVFMILGSTNFILHHRALSKGVSAYFEDEEFRSNIFFTLLCGLTISFCIFGSRIVDASGRLVSSDFPEALRYGLFQVVSIKTTTGFATADYHLWPDFVKFLLLCLMIIGGCSGSTTSAIKHVRFILLFKYAWMQIKRILFPHSVCNVTLNGSRVDTDTLHKVLAFFFVYCATFSVGTLLLLTQPGNDLITSLSASISCLGNVGPALGLLGPLDTYYWMTDFSKIVLSALMVLGRLEIFTVLVLLLPEFWKR